MKINIIIFGIGNVGSTLINQIQHIKEDLKIKHQLELNVSAIANSNRILFIENELKNWEYHFKHNSVSYRKSELLKYFETFSLKEENIIVDVTSGGSFVENYIDIANRSFHIVSANKVANTLSSKFYKELRTIIRKQQKKFYYETNVGAGLPVIDTVKRIILSGDKITKVRGVFSGSLSYMFNTFSDNDISFSSVLNKAEKNGLTETDPRDDLSGKDVARKLLILSRELGLENELSNVKIQSLVPKVLNGSTPLSTFRNGVHRLDESLGIIKNSQKKNNVLRYIGELNVLKNTLEVKLISEEKSSALGQLKGSDNIFEFYTESYGNQPIVVQGAGAGRAVTARGVLADVLKVAQIS